MERVSGHSNWRGLLVMAAVDSSQKDLDQTVCVESAAKGRRWCRVDNVPNLMSMRQVVVELPKELGSTNVVTDLYELDSNLTRRMA